MSKREKLLNEQIWLYGAGQNDEAVQLQYNLEETEQACIREQEIERMQDTIARMRQEDLRLKRTVAQRQGIIAEALEDLKSEHGPFILTPLEKRPRDIYTKRAIVVLGEAVVDTAYFCEQFELPNRFIEGCNWVKGLPMTKQLTLFEVEHRCRICNGLLTN